MSRKYSGSFAWQLSMGSVRIVASFDFSSGIPLVAMTAGTAQPPRTTPPRIIGSVDCPCSPKRLRMRSRTNAMRGM